MGRKALKVLMIILTFVGIFLFFYRINNYSMLLGSLPDLIWTLVFSLALYELKGKYIVVIIPFLMGVSFEVFQYVATVLGFNSGGYYPGYADPLDVVFYFLGSLIAYLILKYLTKF